MTDRWRYRCPDGHTSPRRRPENDPERRYHCLTCKAWYGHVIDAKTGQRVRKVSLHG